MFLLIFYLVLALGVSFLCSIMEAVILSVTPSFADALERESPRTGARLRLLKADIDKPLAAILTLNTIAHTMGAAGVGAQALVVFGNAYVAVSSAVLTLLILVFSEIIPKTLGALYWRKLAAVTARILVVMIWLLYPLVLLSRGITRVLSDEESMPTMSREELQAMADIGRQEGLFREQESRILQNLLRLGKIQAKDVMTPRPVMFTLCADMSVGEVTEKHPKITFSRIPIYEKNPEDIHAFVLRTDILLEVSRGHLGTKLGSFARKIEVVPEIASLIVLFEQLLDRREHIALAVDEYGGVAGIVTMEDIVETLLGLEIVDETDLTIDMQALARQRWRRRARTLGLIPDEESESSSKGKTGGDSV